MKLKIALFSLMALVFSGNSLADEIYQEEAVSLCQGLKQKTYQTKCMEQIKGVQYNTGALAYCGTLKSWNKIRSCLPIVAGKQFEQQALSICTNGKYFNKELKDCLNDIADKSYVSKIEVGLCANEKYYSKQIKCLKAATSKAYEAKPDQSSEMMSREQLKESIKQVYALLKEEKTTSATLLLHDLVKKFEQE